MGPHIRNTRAHNDREKSKLRQPAQAGSGSGRLRSVEHCIEHCNKSATLRPSATHASTYTTDHVLA